MAVRLDVKELYGDGISVNLPSRFTISADTKIIDKAIKLLEKCDKLLDGDDAVILYRVLSGNGGVEKFHRAYAKSAARNILKKDKDKYGEPITSEWLNERKKKILDGEYKIINGIIWGYGK